jgi:Ser/Thr protein kinase RdoA (MazF antagonist)
MTPHDYRIMVEQLQQLARQALGRYGLDPHCSIALLSHSENTMFRIDDPAGARWVLRVHRPDYHSSNAIRSELAWMAALNAAGIATPRVVSALDGDALQELHLPGLGLRRVSVFHWIDGAFPDDAHLEPSMRELGMLSARMHAQARTWSRPPFFERPAWDFAGILGPAAHWGPWDRSPDLGAGQIELLRAVTQLVAARLQAYGRDPSRFGLIHADQRLANLLVDGDTFHIIDFDDCGLGWFLHDLAAALSFIEHSPARPRLIAQWLDGYSRYGSLAQQEIAEIPTFIMQRRLQLLAWRASHAETDLAKSLKADWADATAEMGREYLASMG